MARRSRPDFVEPVGASSAAEDTLLSVEDLRVELPVGDELFPAVDGVSFSLAPGEAVALVGESGCGKSQLARAILGLSPEGGRVSGRVVFAGRDVLTLPERERSVWCSRSRRPPWIRCGPSALRSSRRSACIGRHPRRRRVRRLSRPSKTSDSRIQREDSASIPTDCPEAYGRGPFSRPRSRRSRES